MNDVRVSIDTRPKDPIRMWLPEDLARIRRQELMDEAERYRLIRRFSAGRVWRRLANYAVRRADRLTRE